MNGDPRRALFVVSWLVVGGEETEARLLARALDPERYRLDVVAYFHKEGMPEQTHGQLEALAVAVDTTPYRLFFEERIDCLRDKMADYDLVVAVQSVQEVYPALERICDPPLIEHGGLVEEALAGPKHLTRRYVSVCRSIREAAASRMPERPHHALQIPSMVDLDAFDPADRAAPRAAWGFADSEPVTGWVGRLDRKKRVEVFIDAADLIRQAEPAARFVVVGGRDAFMPDYADTLCRLETNLNLDGRLFFLGDRPDVPTLLAGMDVFVWLSHGEGMPYVIEAGAAGLPVVATPDDGVLEQITHGENGLFIPHQNPRAVAEAVLRLLRGADLRLRLGAALRNKVVREYSVSAVLPRWKALFDEVLHEIQERI